MSSLVTTICRFLSRCARVFEFFERRRARIAADRQLERDHQLAVISQITSSLEHLLDAQAKQNAENAGAVLALAAASAKNADAFAIWLKSFTVADAPTTSVVTEEDEYAIEQQKLAERYGIDPADLSDLPDEFRLAFELRKNFDADVRRD